MTDENLRKFIPNYIQPGMGEDSLVDKIRPYVDVAETWADTYVAKRDFTDEFENLTDLRDNIVAARALYLAAPALDVTMHPNGLAVVNTDALAPASAERSREFRKAIDQQILDNIDRFLEAVYIDEIIWNSYLSDNPLTIVCRASIFYNCADLIEHTGIEHSWDDYIGTLRKVTVFEVSIAEKFISFPLLNEMRSNKGHQTNPLSNIYFAVLNCIKSAVAEAVISGKENVYPKLRRIVNEIRNHPDIFPEWHNSNTAKLFNPPVFKNSRHSGGYFF